jgi:hypothetical protein
MLPEDALSLVGLLDRKDTFHLAFRRRTAARRHRRAISKIRSLLCDEPTGRWISRRASGSGSLERVKGARYGNGHHYAHRDIASMADRIISLRNGLIAEITITHIRRNGRASLVRLMMIQ